MIELCYLYDHRARTFRGTPDVGDMLRVYEIPALDLRRDATPAARELPVFELRAHLYHVRAQGPAGRDGRAPFVVVQVYARTLADHGLSLRDGVAAHLRAEAPK